jgi:hypothetical protein
MRASMVGVLGALAIGCATTGCATTNSVSQPGGPRDVALTENGTYIRTNRDYSVEGVIARPIDEAFAQMMLAYSKLGIPTTTMDTGGHLLGNTAFSMQHRFNGEDVSRYFECGKDATGFPRADRYQITLSVVTTLRAQGPSETEVETLVTARGRDNGGTGADLYCSTTGHLETQLHKAAI